MGGESYQLWQRNLSLITIDKVNYALEHFSTNASPHVPTLGQFHAVCKQTPHEPEIHLKKKRLGSKMVMMVESAKQVTLFPEFGAVGKSDSKRSYLDDWADDDTKELFALIKEFDDTSTLREMCVVLDNHEFTHGSINRALNKPAGSLLCDTYRFSV